MINAIISSENGEDADVDEFKARLDGLGFKKVIDEVKKARRAEGVEADAELDTQLDVFEELIDEPSTPSKYQLESIA